jgi:hypothetical protein
LNLIAHILTVSGVGWASTRQGSAGSWCNWDDKPCRDNLKDVLPGRKTGGEGRRRVAKCSTSTHQLSAFIRWILSPALFADSQTMADFSRVQVTV